MSNALTESEFYQFVMGLWFIEEMKCDVHWFLGVGNYAGRHTAEVIFPNGAIMRIIGDDTGIYMKIHPAEVSGRKGYSVKAYPEQGM
jgi:hypothetical protein